MQLYANGLPILEQFSEEGFVDLVFRITDFESNDVKYRFHLAASHNAREVGMNVEMVTGIQGGFFEDENEVPQLVQEHVYRRGIAFFSTGEDSDRLITAIGLLYGLDSEASRMVENQYFTAIALHEGTLDFDSTVVNIKLFANDGEECSEDEYFESFFNADFANGFAYWNEKDQDYREALLRGMRDIKLL